MHEAPARQYAENPAVPSPRVAALFAPGAAAAELAIAGDPFLLFPEEYAYVKDARPKRQQEFAAGRLCARRAMADFGVVEFPLRSGAERLPQWPASLVGSITHTDGYCAAVVAERAKFASLGLDAELIARVDSELWTRICTPAELDELMCVTPAHRQGGAALLFAAKEAFYKCQFALTHEWLEFSDVSIRPVAWDVREGSFSVQLTRRTRIDELVSAPAVGRFAFAGELVMAGASMPTAF